VHRWWMDYGEAFEAIVGELAIHTGGMGQELVRKWLNRHPKGAVNSMHYALLGNTRPNRGEHE